MSKDTLSSQKFVNIQPSHLFLFQYNKGRAGFPQASSGVEIRALEFSTNLVFIELTLCSGILPKQVWASEFHGCELVNGILYNCEHPI